MINIFYNKNNLKDTMVISIKNMKPTEVETNKDFIILKNNGEIVGINIFDISKKANIKEGYLIFNDQIKDFTHLHLCKVDTKKEVLQIVCGAKNVKKDIYVVVANENTCMPNGMVIIKSKLQGQESCGMLCSEKELLNDPNIVSKGILIIDEKKNQWGSEYKSHFVNA